MNRDTICIKDYFKCSMDEALKIQRRMEEDGLDFSECTVGEFRKAAKAARDALNKPAPTFEQKRKGKGVVALDGDKVRFGDEYQMITLKCDGTLHAKLIAQALSDGMVSFSSKAE